MSVSRTDHGAEGAGRVLATRIASALVMAVPVLVAVVVGPPVSDVLVGAVALVLAWEWSRICAGAGAAVHARGVMAATLLAALAAAAFGLPAIGLGVLVAGSLAVAAASPRTRRAWLAAGTLYIGFPCLGFIWLRADGDAGMVTILWVLGLVWASDIGGYAFGRLIGGPRLAPALSPNKTWAGLGGAVLAAALAGYVAAGPAGVGSPAGLVMTSAALGAAAQMGDLAESSVKRHFGVKDASALIPGHGGLLDRVDALLLVVAVTALIGAVGGGSILTWL